MLKKDAAGRHRPGRKGDKYIYRSSPWPFVLKFGEKENGGAGMGLRDL
jgi:hypothetical protein